ncbi:MAG: protein kinase domain-containing protein [Myxococcota bacterium]
MIDRIGEGTKFGRYVLLDKIGTGGMAEIFRAKTFGAAGFEKEFALKLILPSLVDDSEFVDMFINEAKIAVSLYHANIVQVFDLGEIDDQYYIAMEYVLGKDLLEVLATCADLDIKIPLNLVLFVTMEMLKGLNFAHRAKNPYGEDLDIIHRDVSPSNIMISYAGDVKVGDFGVAKAAIQRNLTESGTLKGKVGYMSPEQVMGDEIDSRSDVFSAAIVFFEALSMSRLFTGNSDLEVMLQVRDADIDERISKAEPLPRDLIEIVRRGLTKHPEERFQTSGEFYQALVDFCYQHSIKVTGTDLSNFMRRLFAEEIQKEETRRRADPRRVEQHMRDAQQENPGSVQQGDAESASPEEAHEPVRPVIEPPPRMGGGAGSEDDSMPGPLGVADSEADESAELHSGINEHKFNAELSQQHKEREESKSQAAPDDSLEDIKSAPSNPQPSSENHEYRYRDRNGLIYGPVDFNTLVTLVEDGGIDEDDLISVDGGPWKSPNDIEGLAEQRDEMAPPDDDGLETIDEDESQYIAEELRAAMSALEEVSSAMELDGGAGMGMSLTSTTADDQASDAIDSKPDEKSSPDQEDEIAADAIREMREQYASYKGNLSDAPFARILARLHRNRATGRLHVEEGDVEKSVFFREGEPILVNSNKQEELLGSFLIKKDMISQGQLEQALARLSEWGGRLGDALVAIGAIPAHEIFRLLAEQMREKLLDVFTWPDGHYGYYENQEPDTMGYPLGVDAYSIIVEACREEISVEQIEEFYEDRKHVAIYKRDQAPVDVERLGLTARELAILNRFDGGTNLEKMLTNVDDRDFSLRTVYLLHQVELLRFEVTGESDLPDL